jgi:two-component system OmpR family sensor kinase
MKKGSRGLSLRARLLLLQLAVAALLLLVLGVVSTKLFADNQLSQFDVTMHVDADRSTQDIQQRPNPSLSAVLVRLDPLQVQILTTGRARENMALEKAVERLGQANMIQRAHFEKLFAVHDYNLTAVARIIPATQDPGAGTTLGVRATELLVVAEQTNGLTNSLHRLIFFEIITGGGLLALLALGGRFLIARGLEPLDRMAETAYDITNRGDLTERMSGRADDTEVGKLRSAINTMLDKIQEAFGARLSSERKVREFAADASHELRTPLTTIRGYAELYRQGALGPDQLPGAMRRIEEEAYRMSTLVAELLELARLDRTSSLDLTETDLATVVRDAVADATAVEPDRPISAQAPPRLLAVVDERRIRQVLSNLLGNVRAHTKRTDSVAVRLGGVQGGVLIEVADSGPGMAEPDAARAFDRFHRASERATETSHSNGSGPAAPDFSAGGGSGLGLSIVQAIALAHGGQATLESWEGHGTRVRIWLPSQPATPNGSSPGLLD